MGDAQERDQSGYLGTYREQYVDDTLDDHERRITTNERRWLMTKGALATLATIKGVNFAIAQLGSIL